MKDEKSSELCKGIEMYKIDKMGGNVIDVNEVWLDEFEVLEECLLGEEGKGFKKVLFGMNVECIFFVVEFLGIGYVVLC